jgi:hypothetical protein
VTRPLRSFAAVLAAASAVALGACSGSGGARPPAADAAPDGVPSSITYWMAPNGSEVNLQLVPTQPTVPF